MSFAAMILRFLGTLGGVGVGLLVGAFVGIAVAEVSGSMDGFEALLWGAVGAVIGTLPGAILGNWLVGRIQRRRAGGAGISAGARAVMEGAPLAIGLGTLPTIHMFELVSYDTLGGLLDPGQMPGLLIVAASAVGGFVIGSLLADRVPESRQTS